MEGQFSAAERVALYAVAAIGAVGLNGVFLYAALAEPMLIQDALRNPVALVFVLEAFVLVVLLALLFRRWGVTRLSAAWFVILSLLGGLALAVPVAALWRRRSV